MKNRQCVRVRACMGASMHGRVCVGVSLIKKTNLIFFYIIFKEGCTLGSKEIE